MLCVRSSYIQTSQSILYDVCRHIVARDMVARVPRCSDVITISDV